MESEDKKHCVVVVSLLTAIVGLLYIASTLHDDPVYSALDCQPVVTQAQETID